MDSQSMHDASQSVICRPWSRDDLMNRLITFKSSTWFAKPKGVNAVSCARRGWVNVGMDTIACESCGARLIFSTPASWSLQQVEKAAIIFSLKLDTGHKQLCLWTDNICDETLALFPPLLASVLVDDYRKRAFELSRLPSLPVISCSALDYMRCPELDQVLEKSVTQEFGKPFEGLLTPKFFGVEEGTNVSGLYYEAIILISLCGWALRRRLSQAVGCKGDINEAKYTSDFDTCPTPFTEAESPSHSKELKAFPGIQYDPNFVVFCCDICGATILPSVFYMVSHPPELLKLVGSSEASGGQSSKNSIGDDGDIHQDRPLKRIEPVRNEVVIETSADNVLVSNVGLPSSGRTIAGGLPPSEQNFKAKISLPLICRNVGLRFLSQSESRHGILLPSNEYMKCSDIRGADNEMVNDKRADIDNFMVRTRIDGGPDQIGSNGSFGHLNVLVPEEGNVVENNPEKNKLQHAIGCSLDSENSSRGKDELHIHESYIKTGICSRNIGTGSEGTANKLVQDEHSNSSTSNLDTIDKSCVPEILEQCDKCENIHSECITPQYSLNIGFLESGNKDSQELKCPDFNDFFYSWLTSPNGENVNQMSGEENMKFDPVKQHKYFCPWIAGTSDVAPGWKQTLSSLMTQEFSTSLSSYSMDNNSVIKMDDPIASIRNLFCSPPTKRRKSS